MSHDILFASYFLMFSIFLRSTSVASTILEKLFNLKSCAGVVTQSDENWVGVTIPKWPEASQVGELLQSSLWESNSSLLKMGHRNR
jgi:hypothetical protein